VRAFLPDGAELGVHDAQGIWRVVPHNLKLRQEIRKASDSTHDHGAIDTNPIEAYLQVKLAGAKSTSAIVRLFR